MKNEKVDLKSMIELRNVYFLNWLLSDEKDLKWKVLFNGVNYELWVNGVGFYDDDKVGFVDGDGVLRWRKEDDFLNI